MRVRAKTIFAGPEACGYPGDLVEVSEGLGKLLIADGAAELVASPAKPKRAAENVESAKAPAGGIETGKAPEGGEPAPAASKKDTARGKK